jgi:L-arabinose isomerase
MVSPPKSCRAVLGVDFGTLSGRAIVVNATDGTTLGSAVRPYAHGVREADEFKDWPVWRPAPDLRSATEASLTAGGPHHIVLSTAPTSEHLWDFAEMTRTELALIDSGTSVRRFLQELRWNQAYYRLASRL